MTTTITMNRRAASIAPTTFDPANRTIDAVLTTGAGVRRRDWDGDFIEVLSLDGADLSRIDAGAVHLLDAHNSYETAAILGAVVSARVDTGGIVGTIALAGREEVAGIVADIAAGTIRALSIGYDVTEWRDGGKDAPTGLPVRIAARWTLLECSVVPVPADAGAGFRAHPAADPMAAARRHETTHSPMTHAAVAEIARAARVNLTEQDMTIMTTISPNAARAAILDRAAADHSAGPRTSGYHAAGLDGPANSLADDIVTAARTGTVSQTLRASVDNFAASGFRSGAHSTSDFPSAVVSALGTLTEATFDAMAPALLDAAFDLNATDLTSGIYMGRLSGPGDFKKVNEGGEIQHAKIVGVAEPVKIATFARAFNITRQVLLGCRFTTMLEPSRLYAHGAAATISDTLSGALLGNAALSDGKAAFHADRANIITGLPGVETLGKARAALRKLKSETGVPLDLAPAMLVCGADDELVWQQAIAAVSVSSRAEFSPFTNVTLVTDSRIPEGKAFVLPSKSVAPVLAAVFLNGQRRPTVQVKEAWETLGLETRGWVDVGAALVSHHAVRVDKP